MKILIIGDTHGRDEPFMDVLKEVENFDLLLYTGDSEGFDIVYDEFSPAPVIRIAGNNDFLTDAPYERTFLLNGFRIFMTHGNRYDLFEGYDRICRMARQKRADILVCGHTHQPVARYEGRLLVLNPGSISYPRQKTRRPTYIVLTLPDDKTSGWPDYEIRTLST